MNAVRAFSIIGLLLFVPAAASAQSSFAPLVGANFHVVHINIGKEDKNLDLAARYNVPLKKGVPALAVLDSDGTLLYSQQQGEFENSYAIGPADVTAFLEKWKPTHANSN